ncbi:hypothetical protein [Natrinema longum]|uniref:Uncharacterized protein n=1 Tax=Natrinema longum TaxID=370324 RepID=A0A8A2UA00_9EURY|nr:hypothetical protein [Natrinema longum]MBZ6496646.1 hypothetical protein [Natrinema longum]QSW85457.1 hypothetical protein J0X27_01015 [Natrinema longum]
MTDHTSRNPASRSDEDGSWTTVRRGLQRRLTSLAWLARAAGVGLSSVSVGFVSIFLLVLERGGELTLITRPLPMRIALAVPPLIAILALATTAGAILGWRNRYWSLSARIHQTILALLGLGFTWQLHVLGFTAL